MNEFVENALIDEKAKELQFPIIAKTILDSFLHGKSVSDLAEEYCVDCLTIENIIRDVSLKMHILKESNQ